jgi:UDP:flavonoid glycosyltransferase YjiC (YdhE family)
MPDIDEHKITLPENIFLAKQIPYSWLLNNVAFVVHHFGFGTTAEVLKAGLPSIPIPHIFDQKIRALKISKLGYAYKPLDVNKIDGDAFSKAIIEVKKNKEMIKKCLEARKLIINENGTEKTADLINDYINQIAKSFVFENVADGSFQAR